MEEERVKLSGRVLLIGDYDIGKRNVLRCLTKGTFNELQDVEVGGFHWEVLDGDKALQLTFLIHKLFPHETDEALKRKYKDIKVVLVCYDCSNEWTHIRMFEYHKRIKAILPETPCCLLELKNDVRSGVSELSASLTAMQLSLPLFSMSARTGRGVRECFEVVARMALLGERPVANSFEWTVYDTSWPTLQGGTKKKKHTNKTSKKGFDFVVLPTDLLSVILGQLNSIAILRLSIVAKNYFKAIWKSVNHIDLSPETWPYQFISRIVKILPEHSKIDLNEFIKKSSTPQISNKSNMLSRVLSQTAKKNIQVSVHHNPHFACTFKITSISSNIVELNNLSKFSFNKMCKSYHLLPSLVKFTSLHKVKKEDVPVPLGIRYLNLMDVQDISTISKMTNLRTFITKLNFAYPPPPQSNTFYSSLVKLEYFKVNIIPAVSLLPSSLRYLGVSPYYQNNNNNLSTLLGYAPFQSLEFDEGPITITNFTYLTHLSVQRYSMDDLLRFTNLQKLTITNLLKGSTSLCNHINFKELHLNNLICYKDFNAAFLKTQNNLTSLTLKHCDLKPSDITSLDHLTQLEQLDIRMNYQLDDTIFGTLMKFVYLEKLYLSYLVKITEEGVRRLSSLGLLYLDITGCLGVKKVEMWRFGHTVFGREKLSMLGEIQYFEETQNIKK